MTRVCFAILVHSDAPMFHRLADALLSSGSTVVVHLDKKVDPSQFWRADVAWVEDPVDVRWGGFSLAEAHVRATRLALSADPDASHVMTLSGMDYLARPVAELNDTLDHDKSYFSFYEMRPGTQMYWVAQKRMYMDLYARLRPAGLRRGAEKMVHLYDTKRPRPSFPSPWTPYRGSAWRCLTREAAELVCAPDDSADRARLNRRMRSVTISDEILEQTLVLNSPLAASVAGYPGDPNAVEPTNGTDLHYIDWSPEREDPAILVGEDLDRIVASGKFFVRKVTTASSGDLLDLLDRHRQS
jgi:hypothetical protein